jgi:pyruvate/2-oxoglutarate dehydrogenase complex dihydrolipoamide dehydrogenase (E3) component
VGVPEFDLCVIGGGAGGLVVAAGGAALGAKIALVEKDPEGMGGDCLHYGCVPSKTLLRSAKVAHLMRHAGDYAITPAAPQVDLAKVLQRVARVIASIQPNDSPERFRALGVDVSFGLGKFSDPRTFVVGQKQLTAKNFVLATGSRPGVPPIPGIEQIGYLTNETVFHLKDPVPSLIVIGAGPIGCEMAQAFARLGTKVSVVDLVQQALPREDPDLAAVVRKQMESDGVVFHLGVTPTLARRDAAMIALTVKTREGVETTLQASHLLVAAGRMPNIENLGLESAGVAIDKNRIVADAHLRTTNKNVYVCGDVAGAFQFTHMAEHHAGVILRNILNPLPIKFARAETRVVPWCTFTEPELARVGLSESEAKQQNVAHSVYRFPFDDMDRARADGETEGFAKIVTDAKGVILGAGIAGPHAGELIHEYVLAVAKGMKTDDLSNTIHVYPTLAQINRRVADQRRKAALTPTAKKWIMRIAGLRGA